MGSRMIIVTLVISVFVMLIENTEACLTPSSTKNEILRKKRDLQGSKDGTNRGDSDPDADMKDGSNRGNVDDENTHMVPDGIKQREITDVPPEDRADSDTVN